VLRKMPNLAVACLRCEYFRLNNIGVSLHSDNNTFVFSVVYAFAVCEKLIAFIVFFFSKT